MATASPWVSAWLARWGRQAQQVQRVAEQDCSIHRFQLPQPSGPSLDLALRIYPATRRSTARIDFEAHWLQALSTQGLWVPAPQRGLDGQFVQRLPDAKGRLRHALLLTWLPGQLRYASLRPVHLWRVGQLVARMHLIAPGVLAAHPAPPRLLAGHAHLVRWADGRFARHAWLTPRQRHVTQLAAARLQDVLRDAGARSGSGLIHGDLHCWNLLFHGKQAGAIDFSDGGRGPWLQDLASVLQFIQHPLPGQRPPAPPAQALQQALLEGYRQVCPLPPDTTGQLPAHLQERMLRSLHWILQDWPRPDLRPWGPAFIEQCTQALARWLDRGH